MMQKARGKRLRKGKSTSSSVGRGKLSPTHSHRFREPRFPLKSFIKVGVPEITEAEERGMNEAVPFEDTIIWINEFGLEETTEQMRDRYIKDLASRQLLYGYE